VGAFNTAMSLVIFTFLAWIFEKSRSSYFIVSLSAIISLLTNYSTQRYFVWRSNSKVWRELPRYAISSGFIYLLNLALIWLFHDRLGLPLIPAQYLSVLLATVASYFILKYFAFTRRA
jgi:putative flippase GtrA